MSDPTATTVVLSDPNRSFFGHPRGLVTCFMIEFFERFTYYGMRSMLVLFLSAAVLAANPGFGVDGATAGAVYGLFTGGAYLLAIPGGWVADRLIGQRSADFLRRPAHRDRQLHPGHPRDTAGVLFGRIRHGARHRIAEAQRLLGGRRAL